MISIQKVLGKDTLTMYSSTFWILLTLGIEQVLGYGYIAGFNGNNIFSVLSLKIHPNISCWLGPDTWPTTYASSCAGSANSPIDIPDHDGTTRVTDWLPFQLIHYEVKPYKMYIENTAHTAKVTFEPDDCHHIPTVVQGNLPGNAVWVPLSLFEFYGFIWISILNLNISSNRNLPIGPISFPLG